MGIHLPAPPTLLTCSRNPPVTNGLEAAQTKGVTGGRPAWHSLGGIFRHIVPGQDCQSQWSQGRTGSWGGEKGGGPQWAWKPAGRRRPCPPS